MELKFVYTLDEACTQPVDAGIRKIIRNCSAGLRIYCADREKE